MSVTSTSANSPPVNEQEIINMRQNLHLLRAQVQTGRVESAFLDKQLEKLIDLLTRVHFEHKQYRKHSRLEGLYNVISLLGSTLDLQEVLDLVMDSIIKLTRAERGFLMLRGDDGQLEVRAARHFDQQTLTGDKFQFSRTVVYEVLDTGVPIITTNAAEDPRYADQASVIGGSLRSIMAVPLRVRMRVIGVIYVDNSAITGLFDESESEMLSTYAAQAAVAIDNARLFSVTDQQLAARVEELKQMSGMDLRLNETLELDKAITLTLEFACRIAQADIGHYGMVQGDHIMTIQNYPSGTEDTQPFLLDRLYPQAREVVAYGEMQIMRDEVRAQSVMFVPILRPREKTVTGLLVLRRAGSVFSGEQREMVGRVVLRAAIAIENAQLYAAVQAADRAKSEFVGIVAHDLKVPMTSILGYADLTLMDGNLQVEQEHYLERIRDTVRRMERLVSDLADISRIENGQFFMEETRVTVDDIIQAVRDNIITEVRRRNHAYIEHIEPNLPDMWVDYYRLLQVLTNLLSNAYKYTPDGGAITLSVRLRGDRIEFSVVDTGIGLSQEALEKLGTKFWRSNDEFTRSQPGTGLGYAITSSLVEQMGGVIEVDSEVGKGSKFTFTIETYKGQVELLA
ncbi:MAG: ATP-binding protein [Anaerolineae bacterium]|nr:ATP-binding protein [Anaerolineae bacterium]NUQ03731.1 GAF domain-containing protein [Anaerolineae bacterium]